MNKYKQVSVYTEYNENSIQSVSVFGCPGSVQDAGTYVEQYTQRTILQNDPNNIEHVKEFFTGVDVVDGVAFVAAGEANVTLVIPEHHVWYNRVDDEEYLYENLMDEWQELLDSQFTKVVSRKPIDL